MKKNKYGNIDDILVGIKIATPIGTIQKSQNAPRISSGPDIHEFILGHEGNFGIITDATLRLRPAITVSVNRCTYLSDAELESKSTQPATHLVKQADVISERICGQTIGCYKISQILGE